MKDRSEMPKNKPAPKKTVETLKHEADKRKSMGDSLQDRGQNGGEQGARAEAERR